MKKAANWGGVFHFKPIAQCRLLMLWTAPPPARRQLLEERQDAKREDLARMIRIGIIGLGWWGKQIITCLATSPRFKVVAGCDIDHNTIAPFAAANGFDLVADYRELLKRPDVDAVAVVTPHLLHEEMAIAAYAAGKQVFCEKPLALTTASAKRILAACAKAKGVLGIGHERRYEPAMEEMRRLFESGALGRLLHMDANVSHSNFRKMDPSNWRRDPKHAPAGAWTALGIHLGDMFVSLAGPPTRVAARTASQIFSAPSEDFVSAEIDFAGGARGRITCLSTPPFYGRLTLVCDQGWVEVQEGGNVDKGIPSSFVHCGPDGSRQTRSYEHTNTVRMNFEAWADALESRAPYRFSTEQLLGNIRILDAVTRSAAADGKPVTL
jgi:predicted dehydrogenase